jgi:hypothetical protein
MIDSRIPYVEMHGIARVSGLVKLCLRIKAYETLGGGDAG